MNLHILFEIDDEAEMGTVYLRQCESAAHAQNLMLKALDVRGTKDVALTALQCDFDGSFGAYTIENGMYVFFILNYLIDCFQLSFTSLSNALCDSVLHARGEMESESARFKTEPTMCPEWIAVSAAQFNSLTLESIPLLFKTQYLLIHIILPAHIRL